MWKPHRQSSQLWWWFVGMIAVRPSAWRRERYCADGPGESHRLTTRLPQPVGRPKFILAEIEATGGGCSRMPRQRIAGSGFNPMDSWQDLIRDPSLTRSTRLLSTTANDDAGQYCT
jgi:hypothetical protein